MKKIFLLPVLLALCMVAGSAYGSAQLDEVISVGTSTPAVGTTTLSTDGRYTASPYFEAFYSYQGSGSCYFRVTGGTPTSNYHKLTNGGSFELDNVKDATRVQFLCQDFPGTITATYSTAKEPIR